ncbi:UDP-N-acetylmuramoyl-L-alanine--D-glutamate ligase [Capnocytophaga gingivalis]|jgi:UDP-N-acetylmuramoyl-L-alanine--D-glutamate ligase|uniref:UDP-N-acetylmuramoylalanine--D-glutamate ligase n=1 Tax=Capnocytophaga gingivalis TaxID=1017 RepID=A0ABU5Y998_9FLAO|nr:UDP-N-acetylmuramoyl-L-alanine--D-glutamate ligase [Capnocytophaga gingivalis]MEB3040512.1 UDP-N-acetylmuramoyl-L-alanine--D-glutamate ligase [Capnocytophaga gingivalis]
MKLVILGGGESGTGAAILGKQKGWEVFLSDKSSLKEVYKKELDAKGIRWEEGQHTESEILSADCIIKSPGIPHKVPIVQQAKAKGIEIISEIEFASRYTDAKIIAITGSNGKTTTTTLVYHLLKEAGLSVAVGGNIGYSFARLVAQEPKEYYVLEISSFQLDDITSFHPHIALLLNITPDHLDRYNYEFQNYIDAKMRITEFQQAADFLIYDADDPVTAQEIGKGQVKAQLLPFSLEKTFERGAWSLDEKNMYVNVNQNIFEMSTKDLTIKGKHNLKNAMGATMVAKLLNVRNENIRNSLMTFQGVPHRLEFVREVEGVRYINDSKATNVNSVYYALDSMEEGLVWIVGGQDKGNDYTPLIPYVSKKVKAIVCLGLDNQKIIQTFQSIVPTIIETHSMEDAVQVGRGLSQEGDTVLLSPACASFDLFQSYEDRGNQFKHYVNML